MNQFFATAFSAVLLASCGSGTAPAGGPTLYNLDFEQPGCWYPYAPGYAVSFDVWQYHGGRQSLRVAGQGLPPESYAFFSQQLPVDAAGREVRLTGWVRTEDADDGLAGIWIGGSDNDDWDPEDPASPAVRGTADWTRLDVGARLSDTAQLIVAAAFTGNGKAWFDDFHITVDGRPLVDSLVPAVKSELTRAERRALRRYIHPLRTWEPGGDSQDLAVLPELVGDAPVVALGEATHGTREIFRMKDRIVRYLAQHEGFDIFSIEAGMPESYAVNRYTIKGEGDAAHAAAGMKFWTWGTESMCDLVEWMRIWNNTQPRIVYTGFDMQFGQAPCRVLRDAFAGDTQTLATLDELNAVLGESERLRWASYAAGNYDEGTSGKLRAQAEKLLTQVERQIAVMSDDAVTFSRIPAGGDGTAWLEQQVTLLRQFLSGAGERDRFMADNLMWIREHNSCSRIAVWAHNSHVKKQSGVMGGYLHERLGDGYRVFGFTVYDGAYTILGDKGPTTLEAQTPYPGTLEYALGQLGEPVFILDLRRMRENGDSALEWLDALVYRSVGSMPVGPDFISGETGVSKAFDYLIFIRSTTPSRVLSQEKLRNRS